MTDIEALRARMRDLAEAAKNAKPGTSVWDRANYLFTRDVTHDAILALDAEITRLREDLDRVTRERDEAKIVRSNYEDLKRAYGTLQAMHRERQDWASEQTARAEAAEAALAKRDEEVAVVMSSTYRDALVKVIRAELVHEKRLRLSYERKLAALTKEPTNAEC